MGTSEVRRLKPMCNQIKILKAIIQSKVLKETNVHKMGAFREIMEEILIIEQNGEKTDKDGK